MKRTAHAVYDIWYHFAWATKYRKKVFANGKISQRAKQLFRTIAAHHDAEIDILEVNDDHVHLLISSPPRIAPAKLVRVLKSYSSHVLFDEFPDLRQRYWGGELWIAGYFVRTAGPGLTKEMIREYIAKQ